MASYAGSQGNFKCKKFAHVRCDQGQAAKCTNQDFTLAKCQRSGAAAQKEAFR